ncbi:hypothetical protein B0J13DRAFT_607875 [Dactylonectria estremocensis]|uniref:DUF676 domain-containing protein n=1 Tax=Dactylonectria estremocensis TaxID=1079267 RepID=A0A9P9ETX9_9HYPO|nr:hypothetical protein B0J13DRAFT_607875 [Dactylonectria estremocensis]
MAMIQTSSTLRTRTLVFHKLAKVSSYIRANIGMQLGIIFIHGLMGDREKTWRGTDGDGQTLQPWPGTFLPSAVPKSRIFIFGYDARIVNSSEVQGKVSVKPIRDHAKELVASVGHMRNQTNTTRRPMVFVCHSLGGLVCKDVRQSFEIVPRG